MNLRVSFPDFPRESCPQRHTISKYLHSIFTTLLWWKNSKRIYAKIATNIGLVLLSWHDTRNAIRNVRRQKLLKMFQQSLLRMIWACQGEIPHQIRKPSLLEKKWKWFYGHLQDLWTLEAAFFEQEDLKCDDWLFKFIFSNLSAGFRIELPTFSSLPCL